VRLRGVRLKAGRFDVSGVKLDDERDGALSLDVLLINPDR
jgi:hypothetical protein